MLTETLQTFVKRAIPIRFGIVPSINSDAAADQAVIVYHLLDVYGLSAVLSYLSEVCPLSRPSLRAVSSECFSYSPLEVAKFL